MIYNVRCLWAKVLMYSVVPQDCRCTVHPSSRNTVRASLPLTVFNTNQFTIESFPCTPSSFLQYTGYFSKPSVQSNEHGLCAFIMFQTESETRSKHTHAKSKQNSSQKLTFYLMELLNSKYFIRCKSFKNTSHL